MRLISPGANPPADVDRYLLPHEQEVITVRKHPAVLLAPVAWAVIGLVIAAVLSDTVLRHDSGLTWIIWAIWGIVFLRFLWAAINWAVDYFIVTSHRFIQTSGLFSRKVAMMPLAKVTDMTFERSPLGRLLGYGTFILESAGQDQALSRVDHIPYPEQLYLEVCSLLFKPSKEDGGD
ncbi:MAG TPA: PH domain-containing protein [Streptosporangiaceae bacterium]|nr:PH domain-containing protein [Streptosporangiaceae bacterium]